MNKTLEGPLRDDDRWAALLAGLERNDLPINVGSFDHFVQSIYALSYPDYDFNTWHVRLMCQKIDKILEGDVQEKYLLGVLPRYHLKSTILGYATTIYRMLTSKGNGIGMYVSYKDELATYHTANIKRLILKNPILNKIMIDLHPQSDSALGFRIGYKECEFITSGIFSVKRGIHTDVITVCDDILGDLNNPMVFSELEKVSRIFHAEIENIPNINCLFIVFGTTIDYTDLLFELKNRPEWNAIWMPAYNPTSEHEVLWETRYNKDWLERKKISAGWKAFSTEFLLTPVIALEAFFNKKDIDNVTNDTLKNYSLDRPFLHKGNNYVVAGLDIGKRRHPSHFSVFVSDENDKLTMIHQSFWDNMEYTEQISRIERAIELFGIDKMYIDNTRGDMDERGLDPRVCNLITFTSKNKSYFATEFAKRVETKSIEFIKDDRFSSQIICVTNDLQAPETSNGHGDSFWSVAMAIAVYQDYFSMNKKSGCTYLGDLQETFKDKPQNKLYQREGVCKICGKDGIVKKDDGTFYCEVCFSHY